MLRVAFNFLCPKTGFCAGRKKTRLEVEKIARGIARSGSIKSVTLLYLKNRWTCNKFF